MRKFSILLILQILFLSITYAKPLSPDGFAYNATLSDAKSSLRQVILPLNVLQNMQRRDYGDLRVFSAEGQIVPHQFIHAMSEAKTQETELTFYPFSQQQITNPANIRVIINQRQGRQSVDINQQLNQAESAKSHEYQYIIENLEARHKQGLCKLKLEWVQSTPSMILPFSLESSDNLQNWKSCGRSHNVSNLSYAGAQLTRKEVDFSCTSDKYLRLTWLKPKQQVRLTKVSGVYSTAGEQAVQWKSFTKPIDDKAGNWLFESDVVASLIKMEFIAPQDGLLYQGKLYSRNNTKTPWRFRKNITQYRLNIGDTSLQSSAFSLTANNDRYWKLEPGYEAQLSENQLPEIRAGWQLQQLVFLAQGNAPFQIAYGNPSIVPTNNTGLSQLIRTFNDTGVTPDAVTVGNTQHNKNTPKIATDIPWKIIGLWALLIIGTGMLAYMALNLYRQMDKN
jgi:hypothetical protein